MGLGSLNDVPLAEARKRAADCRLLKSDGTDPIEARRNKRKEADLEAAKAITFRQCAEAYIEAHKSSWRSAKHAAQWPSTLKTYAYPVFGGLSVQDIDTALVMKVLSPMWKDKPSSANRLRGRIELILDWAKASGYRRAGDNPAQWRGHLDNLLPRPTAIKAIQHHKALPYDEIGKFMEKLRAQEGTAALALQFLILTATRTNEAVRARWREVDLEKGIWTIPAERIKAKKEHRIPLSGSAKNLLASLVHDTEGDYLFPGTRRGQPLSNMAMLALLRRMGYGRIITSHGFRSTFRVWAAERTHYPREVAEQALAHAIESKVEAAYRRTDLFDKRRALMADWSKHCAKVQPAEVVNFKRRA